MSSLYVQPAGEIRVVGGYIVPQNMRLPTSARKILPGAPMWTNSASGMEPSTMIPGQSSVNAANRLMQQLGVGFALEGRSPLQLQVPGAYLAPGDATVAPNDSSTPFITVAANGEAIGPCDSLGAQYEYGQMVSIAGFTNEATTGFYAPDGTLKKDTLKYLYSNKVQIETDPAAAIGFLVERAYVGQTFLKFAFPYTGSLGYIG